MGRAPGLTGRVLYGASFVAGVPLLAVLWARATNDLVPLPALHAPAAGIAIAAGGLTLMVAGWATLLLRGRGLPMNAFPPPVLVTKGVYGWVSDPIYLGFGALAAGVAIAAGSASGLWLVTPILWLAMAALVAGYERPDLRRRFGAAFAPRPRIAWPRGGDGRPGGWERASVLLLVFGPWLLAYYGVQRLGPPPDAFPVEFGFERSLPVLQWTEAVYVLAYLFVPVTPLLLRTRAELRRFAFTGLLSTVVVTLLWLTIPAVVQYRPFEPSGLLGRLLRWEQESSAGVAAFPAFHVVWSLIAADSWSRIGAGRGRRARAAAGWTLALLITASCVTTGMHAILDVVAAILIFIPLRDPAALRENLRGAAQEIANSWREWRLGPVRFLSHGIFAAIAAASGFALAAMAAGPGSLAYLCIVAGAALLGAGLWAQALEGSSKLLRPFGFYGGLLGGLIGTALAGALGADVVVLLGAWAVAAPWIQAIGRLRCLVQGCCHGGPATPAT
ncbi:MAG: phosphatase PAP2 family protein, partial [Gemmatimonadota bacterium]